MNESWIMNTSQVKVSWHSIRESQCTSSTQAEHIQNPEFSSLGLINLGLNSFAEPVFLRLAREQPLLCLCPAHCDRQLCSPICHVGESRSRRSSGRGRGPSSRPRACCCGNPAGSYCYYCCSRDRRCGGRLIERHREGVRERERERYMRCAVCRLEISIISGQVSPSWQTWSLVISPTLHSNLMLEKHPCIQDICFFFSWGLRISLSCVKCLWGSVTQVKDTQVRGKIDSLKEETKSICTFTVCRQRTYCRTETLPNSQMYVIKTRWN